MAESLPGKERSLSILVGCCCCCKLMYQSYQRLSTGDHMGLLESALEVMTALCLEGLVLFRASPILSASQGGVLSKSSPHFPKANTEVLWLIHSHVTRKWQSLTQEHFQMRHIRCHFCFALNFLKLWKMHTT